MKESLSTGELFFNEDLGQAFSTAFQYLGEDGRIASMPDVIDAKLHADFEGVMWHWWLTSSTGEFVGTTAQNNKIILLTHNAQKIMQDPAVIARSTKDTRENPHIQIGKKWFRELESGKHGDVSVFDYATIAKLYASRDSDVLTYEQSFEDPLLIARMGPRHEEFLKKHRDYSVNEIDSDYIINVSHDYYDWKDDPPFQGALANVGRLINLGHSKADSIVTEFDLNHFRWAGRFISIHGNGTLGVVSNKLENLLHNLETNWGKFLTDNEDTSEAKMYGLKSLGDSYFTMYPKNGTGMDTGIAKHKVEHIEVVGDTQEFRTSIGGYHGFFKFGVDEVEKIAPEGANAYEMGSASIDYVNNSPKWHTAPIQFYKVEVDDSKRIMKPDEIRKNYELIDSLLV